MEITRVDPTDQVALRTVYDVERRAALEGREDAPHWSWQEMSMVFLRPDPGEEARVFLARENGVALGCAFGFLPLLDNTDKAWFGVSVDPAHQHQGYGRALLEHVTTDLLEAGRTTLLTEARLPFEHVTDHRNRRFAEAAGFTLSNVEIVRDLALPLAATDLDAWSRKAAERHDGYALRTFGPGEPDEEVPDELLPSLCVLLGQLAVDAPTGEADWEEESITPERYRENQASLVAAGRRMYETVAVAPDGTVAAQTTLAVPPEGSRLDISQWGTFVHREHRGHRLGLAVKAANLRAATTAHPDMVRVRTQNAETNQWMVAINEQMGFEPVEASVEFIKRRA